MSLDVIPMRQDFIDGRAVWLPVFTPEETSYCSAPEGWKWSGTDEPPRNTKFRPDLVMNINDRDGRLLLEALGYEAVDSGQTVDINDLMSKGSRFLRNRIGMLDDRNTDRHVLNAMRMATEGRLRGATHVFIG